MTETTVRNFLYGCARRVAERLYQQVRKTREQHAQAAQVTALVSSKNAVIAAYITEKFPNLTKLARGKKANGAGLVEGFRAGDRVQLNKRTKLESGTEATVSQREHRTLLADQIPGLTAPRSRVRPYSPIPICPRMKA